MPTILLKADPDLDFYVGWSTVTESPHWWGSRAEVAQYLAEDAGGDAENKPERRLARADRTGTSAIDAFAWFGRWDDERFAYEQRGCLPRKHLIAACTALGREDEPAVWDLLEPWEEGMEVHRG
jgi:hypothetical protein